MGTTNTGANTPESAPKKVSAIPGLGKNIVTVLAALGIAASVKEVEAATLLPFTKSIISGAEALNLPENSSRNVLNARGTLGQTVEGRTRFAVTTTTAGTLVVSWLGSVGTGTSFSNDGLGYANQTYDVNQLVQWGPQAGPMTTIKMLDGNPLGLNNDATSSFNSLEGFSIINQPGSATFTLGAGGTFYLDNVVQATNATGAAAMDNVTFSFTPIPESSTSLLAAAGLTGLTLLRRREEKKPATTSNNSSAQ